LFFLKSQHFNAGYPESIMICESH